MLKKWMLTTFILTGMAALTGVAAYGQADTGKQPQRARAASYRQTDIGASFYKTFVSSTTGMGTVQTPSDGIGGMLEVRHIASPFLGYEMTFSLNPADQAYVPKTGACGLVCQNPNTKISAKAAEFALDYVASYKTGNLRPFLVGGLGFFVSIPGDTPYGNNTSVRPTYIYGGGLDWDLSQHLGVRVQYRGNLYKAPNISSIYPATGVYTQSGEPMGGLYYRF